MDFDKHHRAFRKLKKKFYNTSVSSNKKEYLLKIWYLFIPFFLSIHAIFHFIDCCNSRKQSRIFKSKEMIKHASNCYNILILNKKYKLEIAFLFGLGLRTELF